MNILWKGAAALGLAITAMGVSAAPAQAQYYGGGYGYRDGYRGDWDRRYDDRRWDDRRGWRDDDRRHWRGDRRSWRGHYRQRCWTEWRYNHYRDRRVKVRVCN
ncbi:MULTISPECIES: hypothetical protein [Sphingobium]|uniref:Uncharacterized protein n=1 Tax=Sphingobium chungbukense TaxID=56193 RepID=A0A0M3ASI0_9SPHN|nr:MULTISPECIES: hypothetical protein [Sphingobium]KKW93162.1 hypothetical protein YP76_00135 [Sphingobium chungbukense]PJG48662.1 hypothetical protein CAF53_10760 [Sphingobium sp. LB126]